MTNGEIIHIEEHTEQKQAMLPVKISETGRRVIDDELHEGWRQKYYDRIRKEADAAGSDYIRFLNAINARRTDPLELWNPRNVAEKYHVHQTTAYHWMRNGVIPSFQIGVRWFTTGDTLEHIDERASQLVNSGQAQRFKPLLVLYADKGAVL